MDSLTSIIQTLIKTNKDFPQKLKQRLILESNFMENHFKFIDGLFNEGVLSDGSTDMDASFGLKEIIVQLAIMIACSKGIDAIGGLMKAMEKSGNSQLIDHILSWVKNDFGIEACSRMIDMKLVASAVQTRTSGDLPKNMKSTKEMNSSGPKLIDIMFQMDCELIEQLEGHLVGKAANIVNVPQFCSNLAHQNVLDEGDFELKSTQRSQWTEKVIKAACSKQAIGSLVSALQHSGNERILEETLQWLETSSARKKNDPIAVQIKGKLKALNVTFPEQVLPSDGIKKVAALNDQLKSSMKGTFALELDNFKITTRHTDGTVQLWNWRENEKPAIKFGVQVKNITWFQHDEEIIVVGTSEGSVYLFDATTLEEKWILRLGDPVLTLQFVESSLVVATRDASNTEKFWWVDISRPDMRLRDQRVVESWRNNKNTVFFVDSTYTILYVSGWVRVYSTKSGKWIQDRDGLGCYFDTTANISTFNVVDLITTKTNFIAGSDKGQIEMWDSCKIQWKQSPVKTLRGHEAGVVSVCTVSGHLLSLDQSGKLFMWSGYDLENKNVDGPVPRLLAEDFYSVGSLVANERWFATIPRGLVKDFCNVESLFSYKRWFGSGGLSPDGTIDIWTLPDLWLRTG